MGVLGEDGERESKEREGDREENKIAIKSEQLGHMEKECDRFIGGEEESELRGEV